MQEPAPWSTATGGVRVIPLGHQFFPGMPHMSLNPPFIYGMSRLHASGRSSSGVAWASDVVSMGMHTGTHIDSVFHMSEHGLLHGGRQAAEHETPQGGLQIPGTANTRPMLGRGVLLDVAALLRVALLPEDFAITPDVVCACEARAGIELGPGDIALFRTGWDRLWPDEAVFGGQTPGVIPETARLLADRAVAAAGSDTGTFELANRGAVVHIELLVRAGIPIFEYLDLRAVAAEGLVAFQFIALPLDIRGATGSPVSPVAVVPVQGKARGQDEL